MMVLVEIIVSVNILHDVYENINSFTMYMYIYTYYIYYVYTHRHIYTHSHIYIITKWRQRLSVIDKSNQTARFATLDML